MPRTFRRRRFRPRRRRRVYKRRRYVARVARGVVRKMASWKHHYAYSLSGAGTSGGTLSCCDISQGDSNSQRDGDSLYLGSCTFFTRWTLGDSANVCRLILFQWYPTSTPAVADILDTSIGSAPQYMYETDKGNQYKILFDRTYSVNDNYSGQAKQFMSKRIKIRPPRKKIQFLNGSTDGSNKIYFLNMSDSSVVPNPTHEFLMRVNFIDI